ARTGIRLRHAVADPRRRAGGAGRPARIDPKDRGEPLGGGALPARLRRVVIRRLGPGDVALLRDVCRRSKERLPSAEEAAWFLAAPAVHAFVVEEKGEL